MTSVFYSVALAFFSLGFTPAVAQIALEWPVDCKVGSTCEIQHYVDHGDGVSAEDYRCGTVTYKDHNGTDIRVLTIADQRKGVNVLAAADGTVLRARDEMADVSIAVTGRNAVKGRNCGNGVVIAHADGFDTQYCHLARGSIIVKPGDVVKSRQPIGRVGLSGDTEFPHLHITVRHNGEMIDPFAYGEPKGACEGGTSLWVADVQPSLSYKAGAILNGGIASRPLTIEDVDAGIGHDGLTANSPAVLAYIRAITLRKGDVQRIVLNGPVGALVDHSEPPLTANKDQFYMFVGRKRPSQGWPLGRYTATYTVVRDQKVVIEKSFSSDLR